MDKNLSLEKEISSMKDNQKKEKKELQNQIKIISDKNISLEKDISSMKDKSDKEKKELQNQIYNISNMLNNHILQQKNEFNNIIEKIYLMENIISPRELVIIFRNSGFAVGVSCNQMKK